MRSIFDASFQYTPSYDTDLRKTFERLRREGQAQPRSEAPKPRVKLYVSDSPALTRARSAILRAGRGLER